MIKMAFTMTATRRLVSRSTSSLWQDSYRFGSASRTLGKRARLVHEHLLNKDEFWLPYAVATYANRAGLLSGSSGRRM